MTRQKAVSPLSSRPSFLTQMKMQQLFIQIRLSSGVLTREGQPDAECSPRSAASVTPTSHLTSLHHFLIYKSVGTWAHDLPDLKSTNRISNLTVIFSTQHGQCLFPLWRTKLFWGEVKFYNLWSYFLLFMNSSSYKVFKKNTPTLFMKDFILKEQKENSDDHTNYATWIKEMIRLSVIHHPISSQQTICFM